VEWTKRRASWSCLNESELEELSRLAGQLRDGLKKIETNQVNIGLAEFDGSPCKTNLSKRRTNNMRKKNWRLVIAGCFFIVMALGFFFVMQTIAPNSTDPVMAMQITGRVTGIVSGVSVVMILIGLVGKKG